MRMRNIVKSDIFIRKKKKKCHEMRTQTSAIHKTNKELKRMLGKCKHFYVGNGKWLFAITSWLSLILFYICCVYIDNIPCAHYRGCFSFVTISFSIFVYTTLTFNKFI